MHLFDDFRFRVACRYALVAAEARGVSHAGRISHNRDAFNAFLDAVKTHAEVVTKAGQVAADGQPILDFFKWLIEFVATHPEIITFILHLFGL